MMSPSEQDLPKDGSALPFDELKERLHLFQSILDLLPDSIEIIDRDFNVVYLNAAARRRHSETIHKGNKCYQVFFNRSEPCTFCSAPNAFVTGNPGHIILRDVQVRATEPCFEELLSLPLKTDHGNIDRMVEIIKDVTKEKELEQQLIHSGRLISLGELMASIAHEFNNPLGIIMGFAQDLLTEVKPSDPCYQSLKIIEEEASRCKKIMQDLMEFGRSSNPRFALTDVKDVVQRSMDLVSCQLQKSMVKIVIKMESDLPSIYADPQQLQQVLVNLSFNAMEAMPDGGTLTVQAMKMQKCSGDDFNKGRTPRDEVILSVTDTGQGINPDHLSKIFRPFFTSKTKKGMGLGLSICERIMKTHGGRIDVKSTPGQGTTFHLHLPLERRDHGRNS